MITMAIDPGSAQSAYVVWNGTHIIGSNILPNADLLSETIPIWFSSKAGQPDWPDLLAIEMIASYGMPVGAEVFDTCVMIGRFLQAALDISPSLQTRLVKRVEIKHFHCGSHKAKDANIRQAIIDRFGGKDKAIGKKKSPGPLYAIHSHEWAALALALAVHRNFPESQGSVPPIRQGAQSALPDLSTTTTNQSVEVTAQEENL